MIGSNSTLNYSVVFKTLLKQLGESNASVNKYFFNGGNASVNKYIH